MKTLHLLLAALLLFWVTPIHAGWFSEDAYYVIIQRNSSGVYLSGWVSKGLPTNNNGVYVFMPCRSKYEIRVPVQTVTLIKAGTSQIKAFDILAGQAKWE